MRRFTFLSLFALILVVPVQGQEVSVHGPMASGKGQGFFPAACGYKSDYSRVG